MFPPINAPKGRKKFFVCILFSIEVLWPKRLKEEKVWRRCKSGGVSAQTIHTSSFQPKHQVTVSKMSCKFYWALYFACAFALAQSVLIQGYDSTFESANYHVEIFYPNFTLYAKYPDGSIYRDQYVTISLESGMHILH
jgi:hypothetical protein